MKKENITKFKLEPDKLPRMSRKERGRLDGMTDEEIHRAALSDPDAQPLTAKQLGRMRRVVDVKDIRRKLKLTQREFAEAFHLSVGTVRDWEQRRCAPDQAAQNLLKVIALNPEAVKEALEVA